MEKQSIFTTRIDSTVDPIEFSITLSNLIYHSTKSGNRPNSVILADKENYKFTIPSAALIHYPHNAPILLTNRNNLDDKVEKELKRLSPSNSVFLVGDLSKNIEKSINGLGLKPYSFISNDPIDNAINIYNFLNKPMEVIIVSIDSFEESMLSCSWAAHMGTPIIFTNKTEIPPKTVDLIRQNNITSVYVIGGRNSISFDIVKAIKDIKSSINVQRIQGNNSHETSVNFVKFHDVSTMFGWGYRQKQGYALSFCNKDNWQHTVCASLLSHTGKHTPMLLINKDSVPKEVKTYIDSINPSTGMSKPPFLHGYIIGGTDVISYKAQLELDSYLKNTAWFGNKKIEKMSYKMKNGDSIQSLANLYNITEQELMQFNSGLVHNMIHPGQTITIPVTMDLQ
ncbi:cell wall-binding repeat-containing protein [Wukongibacter sp. M2B1]|uniref:cell wall-binding repeat-containing protein n=1 Tax=Wukongibacter sp. M2B1 TaxID=3088895 RepID=UPI003D7AEDB6